MSLRSWHFIVDCRLWQGAILVTYTTNENVPFRSLPSIFFPLSTNVTNRSPDRNCLCVCVCVCVYVDMTKHCRCLFHIYGKMYCSNGSNSIRWNMKSIQCMSRHQSIVCASMQQPLINIFFFFGVARCVRSTFFVFIIFNYPILNMWIRQRTLTEMKRQTIYHNKIIMRDQTMCAFECKPQWSLSMAIIIIIVNGCIDHLPYM